MTNARILDAAVELIDRSGLGDLSMRHLGAALGVEAMSLYRHFPSKGVLLEAVVGRLLAELVLPVPGHARWEESFRALARGYRQLLLRHPNAIPLLATLQLSNPGALSFTVGAAVADHIAVTGAGSSTAGAESANITATPAVPRKR